MTQRKRWGAVGPLFVALTFAHSPCANANADIVFADFEGETYGAWKVEGTAFGSAPARGTLPGQMPVDGFQGRGLANSYVGGDKARGRLVSPEFAIARQFISFLIGGGGWEGKTCINLIVDGKTVRSATGPNMQPGGSERLELAGWDVSELRGKTARLEIVDEATGGWGHINVDHIQFTDTKPPLAARLLANVSREIVATGRWLNFPVKNGAKKRSVTVGVDGKIVRRFEIELADAEADWWAPLEVGAWRGKTLAVTVDQMPENSRGLEQITQGKARPVTENLYREPLRPQLHFSAQRGWLNDPNGLVFYQGNYHRLAAHRHAGHALQPVHEPASGA